MADHFQDKYSGSHDNYFEWITKPFPRLLSANICFVLWTESSLQSSLLETPFGWRQTTTYDINVLI